MRSLFLDFARKLRKRRKMQISKIKSKTAAVTAILLIASVLLITNLASVQAQDEHGAGVGTGSGISGPLPAGVTPDFTVKTVAYISIRPSVVGLGQTILINLFPVPAPNANRNFPNLKTTITKPSGQTEVVTMNSYVADGTAWFEWVTDELGTWKFKLDFPGVYFPAGRYLDGYINNVSAATNYPQSVYYQPSTSKEMTITVQQDWVYSWPEMPLPTDYWTRPVPYEMREW